MQQDQKFYEDFFTKHNVSVHDDPSRFMAVSALLTGRVLDVACGTGSLADYYSGEYMGIDWSRVAIGKAREIRRKDAEFSVYDPTNCLSALGNDFDSAYCGEFLEHIEDDSVVFQNIIKNVKKGGRVIFTVPNGDRVPDESHCRIFTVPQIRRDYSKYGMVRFHNWSGEHDRIMFSIDLGVTPEEEITLVMIAKDEAKGIERAILSALAFVDKVVVSVDSKTTDNTREIAERYADVLKEHVWADDFSAARNFAQEGVTSRWILFLDGHEYIEKIGKVKDYLMLDVEGIFVTVKMESGMTFLYPRIYDSKIKFVGAVHNLNDCKTKRACPDFLIIHDREHGQDEEAIIRRNKQRETMLPKAMKAQLEKDPNNLRALFHLGNWYLMRRENALALKYYKLYMKHSKSPEEAYMVELNIGLCHATLGNPVRAMWAFRRAEKLLPNRWETARVLGGLYFMEKDYKKAVQILVSALTPSSRAYLYQPIQPNYYETWDLIGHCFVNLDQNEQAVRAWEQAQTHAKSEEQKADIEKKIELVKTLLPKSK